MRFDAVALEAEVASLPEAAWVPHFNTQLYSGDWSGVALRSVGGRPQQLYPDPAATEPFADTALLAELPALRAVVRSFACELQAVRLLRLGPGAAVGEHRDHALRHQDGELRVSIPVTTNAGAVFHHDGAIVPMRPGEAWYMDLTQMHAVQNDGAHPRVHLLVDCVVNPWLDEQLAAGSTAA
jgi:hypothetical protein